jgi:hypothetical protein
MFESLFQYPTVLARHRDGPAADERRRFLLHRAKEGAASDTLLGIARELLVIAKHINVTTAKAIGRQLLKSLLISGLVTNSADTIVTVPGGQGSFSYMWAPTGSAS